MLRIQARTIKHSQQRFPTVGDYWNNGYVDKFRISDLDNWRMEVLVLIHEMVEYYICLHRGIEEPDILEFDKNFEEEREQGLHGPEDEPGHDIHAPYHKEHVFAEKIEKLLAEELGVNWEEYDKKVNAL